MKLQKRTHFAFWYGCCHMTVYFVCPYISTYSNFKLFSVKINQFFLTILFSCCFFPLVSIVALLAATDAIITLSQNAIWALYVGCLLRGATHNIYINSIHQLLEPSFHNRNTCSYFLFTAAVHKPCKQEIWQFLFLMEKRL